MDCPAACETPIGYLLFQEVQRFTSLMAAFLLFIFLSVCFVSLCLLVL